MIKQNKNKALIYFLFGTIPTIYSGGILYNMRQGVEKCRQVCRVLNIEKDTLIQTGLILCGGVYIEELCTNRVNILDQSMQSLTIPGREIVFSTFLWLLCALISNKIRQVKTTVANQRATIADRDALIAAQSAVIVNQHAVIVDQRATIADRDALIAAQHAVIANQHAVIVDQRATIADRDALIAAQSAVIVNQELTIANERRVVAYEQLMRRVKKGALVCYIMTFL